MLASRMPSTNFCKICFTVCMLIVPIAYGRYDVLVLALHFYFLFWKKTMLNQITPVLGCHPVANYVFGGHLKIMLGDTKS